MVVYWYFIIIVCVCVSCCLGPAIEFLRPHACSVWLLLCHIIISNMCQALLYREALVRRLCSVLLVLLQKVCRERNIIQQFISYFIIALFLYIFHWYLLIEKRAEEINYWKIYLYSGRELSLSLPCSSSCCWSIYYMNIILIWTGQFLLALSYLSGNLIFIKRKAFYEFSF